MVIGALHFPASLRFRENGRVPSRGVEPPRDCSHRLLKPERLPVPPRGRVYISLMLTFLVFLHDACGHDVPVGDVVKSVSRVRDETVWGGEALELVFVCVRVGECVQEDCGVVFFECCFEFFEFFVLYFGVFFLADFFHQGVCFLAFVQCQIAARVEAFGRVPKGEDIEGFFYDVAEEQHFIVVCFYDVLKQLIEFECNDVYVVDTDRVPVFLYDLCGGFQEVYIRYDECE